MQIYDFMMRLPHDLCFRIADYLYFEDLLRVRLVSRSWYQAFCKTDICAHAIQKQTSLPLEQFFQSFRVNYAELDDKMKDDCHRKYMINRIRREHGIARSIFELEYNLNARDTTVFKYSEGRVVICSSGIIIVEDLETRLKSILQYPPNINPISAEFSSLVGHFFFSPVENNRSDGTSAQLAMWNIISRRLYLFPEPYVIINAASFQNQVGLFATNSSNLWEDFIFLSWDEESGFNKLLTFANSNNPRERIVNAGIFFHPCEKGIIFIIIQTRMLSMFDSSNYGTRITVYCYEDYKLISTQQEIIKTKTLPAEDKIEKYNDGNQICINSREPPFGWIPRSLKSYKFVHRTIVTNQGPESRWFPVQVSNNETPLDQEPVFGQERQATENQPSDFGRESYIRWIKRDLGYVPLVQFGKSSDETFYEHLIYDMNTRQFTRFNIPLHPTYQECLFGHGSFIWNDQVFIRARHENVEKLQVITLSKGLSGLWNGWVGKDDLSHSSGSSITRGENRLSCRSSPFEFQDGLQDKFES
ncbi:hypothetical protein EPUL_005500, partial [Erysiphe pulchra]